MRLLKRLLPFLLLSSSAFGAISAATVWEIRTTGAQTNGGGFVAGATGDDFSQQDEPEWNDLAVTSEGAGTTMLTASADANMVGNILYVVSGTNATVDRYEIKSVSAGTSITTDKNWCTGACADGVVDIGGALTFGGLLDDDIGEDFVAGNTIYIKAGTYTLGEQTTWSSAGSTTAVIKFIGYNTNRGDEPTGTDRPLIAGGGYYIRVFSYWLIKNIRFSSDTTYVFYISGGDCTVINCKATAGASSSARAFYNAAQCVSYFGCEGSCSYTGTSEAFHMGYSDRAVACYAHDAIYGFRPTSGAVAIIDCIADSCRYGIGFEGGQQQCVFVGNTIVACLNGFYNTTGSSELFLNNIITGCYVGAVSNSTYGNNVWDYNCWYNNGTDYTNITAGDNDVTSDPKLGSAIVEGADGATDGAGTAFTAASNPFSGVTTSDCLNIVEVGTGATLGVYPISAVVGDGELTLSRSAGANKSGIDYRLVKGSDFTLGAGSSCFNTGLNPSTYTGL